MMFQFDVRRWVAVLCFFMLSFCAVAIASAQLETTSQAQQEFSEYDFSEYYDQVYQIRVLSPQAGSKSSIGSGFQVSADGVIVTNYHVVSDYVQSPESHQIQYRAHNGETGDLVLLDFDVIHDLAVLRHSKPSAEFFTLSQQALAKGESVYALGNPRDYGITLVRGPNNGYVEHSYNEQILFSGSLNPGMSGGPALNKQGHVVGVNVATAGSQLSFLVPVSKAVTLVSAGREIPKQEYQQELSKQIKQWQRGRIQELIDADWAVEEFAAQSLFGEIRKDFQCWGQTNEDNKKRNIEQVSKSCSAGDSIYLSSALNAGQVSFSFSMSRSIGLTATQFAQHMEPGMRADNRSNFENATNYRCHVDFLQNTSALPHDSQQGRYNRVTTCVRAYKKLPGLYDSLLLVERNSNRDTLSTHLSLSAVEKDQLQALNRKFMERSL